MEVEVEGLRQRDMSAEGQQVPNLAWHSLWTPPQRTGPKNFSRNSDFSSEPVTL